MRVALSACQSKLTLGFNCLGLRKDDSEVPHSPNSALSSIVCGKAAMSAEMWKELTKLLLSDCCQGIGLRAWGSWVFRTRHAV